MAEQKIVSEFVENKLKNNSSIELILLTGSYAKGVEDKNSDIDLMIFHDKLNASNTRDRIENTKFNRNLFQLQHTTLKEVLGDIENQYDFRIDQLRNCKVLFDKNNNYSLLEKKIKDFKFNINIKSRLEQAKDNLRKFEKAKQKKQNTKAKLIAIQTAFWLAKDYLNNTNISSTSLTEIFETLKEINADYSNYFEKIIGTPTTKELSEIEKNLKKIIKNVENKIKK